jgi:hypothetical protein
MLCGRLRRLGLGQSTSKPDIDLEEFPKMARLSREVIITEKIDGTNAQICIGEDGSFQVGNRTRGITPENDHFGFAAWEYANQYELLQLGAGRHFGEWWGQGIQRGYGLTEKRFSLFDTARQHGQVGSMPPKHRRNARFARPASRTIEQQHSAPDDGCAARGKGLLCQAGGQRHGKGRGLPRSGRLYSAHIRRNKERSMIVTLPGPAKALGPNQVAVNSWKAAWHEIGGQRKYYRSNWEANYAYYLQWLKEGNHIADWKHEPKAFWFEGVKRGTVSYLPDFWVLENDDRDSFHEVKGWMDARSKTKIARMAKYYPNVTLVVIDSKAYRELRKKVSGLVPGWSDKPRDGRGSMMLCSAPEIGGMVKGKRDQNVQ